MKSMPLFKVTGANGITGKQAGAPSTSSSLPRLIEHYEPQGRFSCTHQGSLISMEIPTNWTQVTTRL